MSTEQHSEVDRTARGRVLAVTQPRLHLPSKRDLLFFDQVGIVALARNLPNFDARTAADIEFLLGREAVFEAKFEPTEGTVPGATLDELAGSLHDRAVVATLQYMGIDLLHNRRGLTVAEMEQNVSVAGVSRLLDVPALSTRATETVRMHLDAVSGSEEALARLIEKLDIEATEYANRILCNNLSMMQEADVVPILVERPPPASQARPDAQAAVLEVVLSQFPTPDDTVSWEQVLEFRQDEEAALARRRLRRWMRQVTAKPVDEKEVEQELQYLLDEYESYMKLHRMKTNRTTLESVIMIGGELLENLTKLRFGKLAQSLFVLKDRQIALLEAERDAPGREVAYIASTRAKF